MKYRVERATITDRDLESIFDFLEQSYLSFGDSADGAIHRAERRVIAIERAMQNLGGAPHQGTLCNHILPGLRCVTKNRAVFYFEADDKKQTVHVLAIFFGGKDHQREMLKRLRSSD